VWLIKIESLGGLILLMHQSVITCTVGGNSCLLDRIKQLAVYCQVRSELHLLLQMKQSKMYPNTDLTASSRGVQVTFIK